MLGNLLGDYIYSALYEGHKIVLNGEFELLVDGVVYDKNQAIIFF